MIPAEAIEIYRDGKYWYGIVTHYIPGDRDQSVRSYDLEPPYQGEWEVAMWNEDGEACSEREVWLYGEKILNEWLEMERAA